MKAWFDSRLETTNPVASTNTTRIYSGQKWPKNNYLATITNALSRSLKNSIEKFFFTLK